MTEDGQTLEETEEPDEEPLCPRCGKPGKILRVEQQLDEGIAPQGVRGTMEVPTLHCPHCNEDFPLFDINKMLGGAGGALSQIMGKIEEDMTEKRQQFLAAREATKNKIEKNLRHYGRLVMFCILAVACSSLFLGSNLKNLVLHHDVKGGKDLLGLAVPFFWGANILVYWLLAYRYMKRALNPWIGVDEALEEMKQNSQSWSEVPSPPPGDPPVPPLT